jgi:arginase
LRPDAVAILGPRDADDLRRSGIASLRERVWLRSDRDLGDDISGATITGLAHVIQSVAHFWLHVDLDVLSSSALSAVDYQQAGGLSWEQLERVTSHILAHPGCIGWSIAIYNPDLDTDGHGARNIVGYIETSSASAHER